MAGRLSMLVVTAAVYSTCAHAGERDRIPDPGAYGYAGTGAHPHVLYPIRYGYRGGPYTRAGKIRAKVRDTRMELDIPAPSERGK
jgi:hypothetical protein